MDTNRIGDLSLTEETIPEKMIDVMKPYLKTNNGDILYALIKKYVRVQDPLTANTSEEEGLLTLTLAFDPEDKFVAGRDL